MSLHEIWLNIINYPLDFTWLLDLLIFLVMWTCIIGGIGAGAIYQPIGAPPEGGSEHE